MTLRDRAVEAHNKAEEEHQEAMRRESERFGELAISKLQQIVGHGLIICGPDTPDDLHPPYYVYFSIDGVEIRARREWGKSEFYVKDSCHNCGRVTWHPFSTLAQLGEWLAAEPSKCSVCVQLDQPAKSAPGWRDQLADAIAQAIDEALA